MTIFLVGVVLVLIETGRRCWKTLDGNPIPEEAVGEPEKALAMQGCC